MCAPDSYHLLFSQVEVIQQQQQQLCVFTAPGPAPRIYESGTGREGAVCALEKTNRRA